MPRLRTAGGVLLLALVVGLALFLDLGRPALWDPGEGRYAQTVREMMVRGSWLAPTLNFKPYFDKPPGYYWAVAASFHVFGMTEWAARLPSALAALVTIVLTVGFTWRRLGAATALLAGAILSTSVEFVALARSVRMDMILTAIMTATLFHAYALWEEETQARRTWPLYVLPALGLLAKGPVAVVLPLLIVAALTLVTGEVGRLRRWRPGAGALVGVAIAATSYVAAAIYAPDYLVDFLWRQNVGRFVNAATGHRQPVWYFLWILPVTFLPWALFLPGALRHTLRRARRWHELDLFLLTWLGVMVGFFSLSRAKLATYVLPVFPSLAIMVASYVVRVTRAPIVTRARALAWPALVWTTAIAAAAVVTPPVIGVLYPGYGWRAALTLTLLPFALLGGYAIRRAQWRALPALMLVCALVTQVLFYRAAAPLVDDFASLLAAAVAARALPLDAPVFAYKTRGHSFAFYDGRIVTRVTSPQAAADVLDRDQPAALLTKTRYFERIRRFLHEPACIWWQGASGLVLLTNRPIGRADGGQSLTPSSEQARLAPPAGRPHC